MRDLCLHLAQEVAHAAGMKTSSGGHGGATSDGFKQINDYGFEASWEGTSCYASLRRG